MSRPAACDRTGWIGLGRNSAPPLSQQPGVRRCTEDYSNLTKMLSLRIPLNSPAAKLSLDTSQIFYRAKAGRHRQAQAGTGRGARMNLYKSDEKPEYVENMLRMCVSSRRLPFLPVSPWYATPE